MCFFPFFWFNLRLWLISLSPWYEWSKNPALVDVYIHTYSYNPVNSGIFTFTAFTYHNIMNCCRISSINSFMLQFFSWRPATDSLPPVATLNTLRVPMLQSFNMGWWYIYIYLCIYIYVYIYLYGHPPPQDLPVSLLNGIYSIECWFCKIKNDLFFCFRFKVPYSKTLKNPVFFYIFSCIYIKKL